MGSQKFYLKPMLGRYKKIILSSATSVSWFQRSSLLVGLTITCLLTVSAPVNSNRDKSSVKIGKIAVTNFVFLFCP